MKFRDFLISETLDYGLGFLRALAKNPYDDTTHLVFADWLDENSYGLIGQIIRDYVNGKRNNDWFDWTTQDNDRRSDYYKWHGHKGIFVVYTGTIITSYYQDKRNAEELAKENIPLSGNSREILSLGPINELLKFSYNFEFEPGNEIKAVLTSIKPT